MTRIRWTYNPDPNKVGTIEEIADDGYAHTLIAQGRAVLADPTENNDPSLVEPELPASLRSVCIYYSIPNGINGRFDNVYAGNLLGRYDDVVLGIGLADPESVYYPSTVEVIAAMPTSTVLWGYIDLGVTTTNHSMAAIQVLVEQWANIGVHGIFWDLTGYDYHVSRARQNEAISIARTRDLRSFLNVWDSDDLCAATVNATYNPTGAATVADHRDVMLLESLVFNTDAYGDPGWAGITAMRARVDKARLHRRAKGIKIYGSSIVKHTGRTSGQLDVYRGLAELLARAYSLDGSACSVSQYAAGGDDLALVVPHRWLAPDLPFRPAATYVMRNFDNTVERADLGITIDFPDIGDHEWTLDP